MSGAAADVVDSIPCPRKPFGRLLEQGSTLDRENPRTPRTTSADTVERVARDELEKSGITELLRQRLV